jgi:hypothetical protein
LIREKSFAGRTVVGAKTAPVVCVFQFFTRYLGVSSMSNSSTIRELTSIIVPCYNQVEFTRQCIAAVKEHTRPAWELVVIDNGSNDGTAAYLAGVRDMATTPVTVVSNTKNLGFPAAINQGLRLARGKYLVMLNNDVVVTDGWLDQLIGLVNAKRGPSAGGGPPFTVGNWNGAPEAPSAAPEVRVGDASGPTPPGPPFTRGGKVMVPPSVDRAGAVVKAGEPCAAPSSLPTAYCLLPTAYCFPHRPCWPHVQLRGSAAVGGSGAVSWCRGNAPLCQAMAR